MKGTIVKDWSKVNWKNPEHRKMVGGALANFLMAPEKSKLSQRQQINAAIQEAFSTTGDFPQTNLIKVLKQFQTETHYDTGFEEVFDVRDFTGTNESGFDISDITENLTFALKLPGEKVQTYSMSGTKQRIFFNYYGGALGWHQSLIDDKEYWTMENSAKAFRNKAYSFRALSFYALIEAIGAAQNTAWQLPVDAAFAAGNRLYTAERDVATINLACQTIFQNCKNKGYNLQRPDQTGYIVLAPLELYQRMSNAMSLNLQGFSGSAAQARYNWRLIITDMFVTRNVYYVILPKNKMIAGYRMDLTLWEDFDILSLIHSMAGWMRWGGTIADQQQLQRCAIA